MNVSLRVVALFVFATAVLSASPVSADPTLDELRAGAHVEKMMSIADEIHLEGKQEKIFWELYNNYQRDLQKLGDDRIRLIKDAKEAGEGLTDARATELIRRALGLEEKRLATKRRHVGLFLEKLPPRIVARYFQLENKIQTEIDGQIADKMPLVGR